jgi:energy-coupling factor transporter ATP-binding protein EcfA2
MIDVQSLSYNYPGYSGRALYNVSLHIPEGQLCAIVGANRAGKSTLCYALAGYIPHFYHGTLSGSVRVAGVPVADTPLGDLAGIVGLVVQNPFNQITGARFTVLEEVAFGLENLGVPRDDIIPRVRRALALTGLDDLEDRSPVGLSGGQQQRLAIASVIAMQPQILILDEPTSQLDPVGTREVLAALKRLTAEAKTTIVLVEHKLEWIAAYADRVIALAHGQIAADGDPREVLAQRIVEEIGVGSTRYTQAARLAQERGLAPVDRPLPVTLEQAVEFFQ